MAYRAQQHHEGKVQILEALRVAVELPLKVGEVGLPGGAVLALGRRVVVARHVGVGRRVHAAGGERGKRGERRERGE